MRSINIDQTPDNRISIHLNGGVSIQIGGAAVIAPPSPQHPVLEWSQTLLGGESATYKEAEAAIAELGDGWRMPTRMELESLLNLTRHDPAIDTEQYPDTKSSYYWTSTPCAWNEAARWVVDFGFGLVNVSHRYGGACVRAVRAGQ